MVKLEELYTNRKEPLFGISPMGLKIIFPPFYIIISSGDESILTGIVIETRDKELVNIEDCFFDFEEAVSHLKGKLDLPDI
jgi:hypothetical protein